MFIYHECKKILADASGIKNAFFFIDLSEMWRDMPHKELGREIDPPPAKKVDKM